MFGVVLLYLLVLGVQCLIYSARSSHIYYAALTSSGADKGAVSQVTGGARRDSVIWALSVWPRDCVHRLLSVFADTGGCVRSEQGTIVQSEMAALRKQLANEVELRQQVHTHTQHHPTTNTT